MSLAQAAQMEEMPTDITIYPLIISFFEKLTDHQLGLLLKGQMEETNMAPLRELLLDIIKTLTTDFLPTFWTTDVVTEDIIKLALGNSVTDCFKAALGVTVQGQSPSAKLLRDMIAEEVTATIQCSMSSPDTPMEQYITPPSRLDQMLKQAVKMIKAIGRKMMMNVSTCSEGEVLEESEQPTTSQLKKTEQEPEPAESVKAELSDESESQAGDFPEVESMSLAQAAQMEEMPADRLSMCSEGQVQSDQPSTSQLPQLPHTAEKTEVSAESKANPLLRKHSWCDPSTTEEEGSADSVAPIQIMVKAYNKKKTKLKPAQLLKAGSSDDSENQEEKAPHVFRRSKTLKKTKQEPEPAESVKAGTSVESESQEENAPDVDSKSLNKIFSWDLNSSTEQDDSDVPFEANIMPYNKNQTKQEPEPAESVKAEAQVESKPWDEGWDFSGGHIEIKVMSYKGRKEWRDSGSWMEVFFVPRDVVEEEVPSATPAHPSQEQKRENALLLFLENLVSRTIKKCKVQIIIEDPATIIEPLMNRTWAAVEDIDFDSSPKTFANFEKTLLNDLIKKWGGPQMLLLDMRAGEPILEEFIASAVKTHLLAPVKRRSSISRFFSSVGRTIASICKRKPVDKAGS